MISRLWAALLFLLANIQNNEKDKNKVNDNYTWDQLLSEVFKFTAMFSWSVQTNHLRQNEEKEREHTWSLEMI